MIGVKKLPQRVGFLVSDQAKVKFLKTSVFKHTMSPTNHRRANGTCQLLRQVYLVQVCGALWVTARADG